MSTWMLMALIAGNTPAMASDDVPTSWTLSPSPTALQVLVTYDRKALMKGHDHVLAPERFTGTVTWDVSDVSTCAVNLSFPVTALRVDPAGTRAQHGYEGATPDGDKAKIRANAIGKQQLDASSYPSIGFTSTSCTPQSGGTLVRGHLTAHGVKVPVEAAMKVSVTQDTFRATGRFQLSHADLGMKPYTAVRGALRNAPQLTFHIDVSGTPTPR